MSNEPQRPEPLDEAAFLELIRSLTEDGQTGARFTENTRALMGAAAVTAWDDYLQGVIGMAMRLGDAGRVSHREGEIAVRAVHAEGARIMGLLGFDPPAGAAR